MCVICGQLYCPTNCPEYDPREDPWVSGYCERCGVPLYIDGATHCAVCGEELEEQWAAF